MNIRRRPFEVLAAISLAVLTWIVTASSALAIPATAKSPVNVRTGPSTSYNRVDTLDEGELVDITECKDGWCFIEHDGPDGWVSGNYLIQDPNAVLPDIEEDGAPTPTSEPQPNADVPRVCFYAGTDFTGNHGCISAGTQDEQMTGYWNDKISSIQVESGASITVCRDWFFKGFCETYDASVSSLNGFLNHQISSYRTQF
ncbi:MAG: SH3 domain-containing protein [Hyphomicrobiaceae bacterium]|nr:SH3 domain-containing protein [Hyphomicrobiaceae bacterium]MCC0023253.1 SH3 domain-containing protein [Hyphomicrobiaceae bacterium]